MKNIIFVASCLLLVGCLQTRNEVRESEHRNVMQQQVVTLQKTNADVGNRFADIEEQMRELNGRVEVVENKIDQGRSSFENNFKSSQQQSVDTNQKVTLLQEALTKMEGQIFQLTTELQALKSEKASASGSSEKSGKQNKKDSYEIAQDFFDKKEWKQGILNFQKYRDEHPKGKYFADSTYKIGVSFQELGMKEEAKTFFDEVVSKFPKSEEARRAKIRLKGIKK